MKEIYITQTTTPKAITRNDVDGVTCKYIPNTNDMYAVSKLGAVYSFSNKMNGKRIGTKVQSGYIFAYILFNDGMKKMCYVHRLIAEAFIPKPEGKDLVIHINDQRDDNRVENLCWATMKDACSSERCNKLSESLRKYYKNRGVFGREPKRIAVMNMEGEVVCISPSIQEAAKYISKKNGKNANASAVQISGIISGKFGFRTVGSFKVKQVPEEEYQAWAAKHMENVIKEESSELSVEQVKKLNKIEGVTVILRRMNPATGEVEVQETTYEKGDKIVNELK